jgi:hypothetical protein
MLRNSRLTSIFVLSFVGASVAAGVPEQQKGFWKVEMFTSISGQKATSIGVGTSSTSS